jgi:hypothetical protein
MARDGQLETKSESAASCAGSIPVEIDIGFVGVADAFGDV